MAQANITLSALTGDVSFAQRTIILNPDHPATPIGRASKSLSKGILGASDNAWFDSPVMSREHAEVSLSSITKMVTVHDLGSMHGTFLNNERLSPNQPSPLNNGDVIVFGAEVRRGPELFPACSFQVNIDWSPYQAGSTFSFPNSSDIEEEEGFEFSDPHVDNNGQVSSEDESSIETPQPIKAYHAINAIDLTRDDSPTHHGSIIMDLTNDFPVSPPVEGHTIESRSDRPVVLEDCTRDSISGNAHSRDFPILTDAGGDYGLLSSDSDDEPFEISDSDSDSSDSSDDLEEPEQYEQDEELISENEDANKGNFEVEEERIEATIHQPIAIGGSRYKTLPETENSVDSDRNSDFDLYEEGAEGFGELPEDDPQVDASGYLDSPPNTKTSADIDHKIASSLYIPQASTDVPFSCKSIELVSELHPIIPPSRPISEHTRELSNIHTATAENTYNERTPEVRQPSPSDAAMVKAAYQQRPEQTTNEIPVHHLKSQKFSQLSQTLGDKIGKQAFFEAREKNKAKFFSPANTKGAGTLESPAPCQSALPSNVLPPRGEVICVKPLSSTDNTGIWRPFQGLSLPRTPNDPVKFGENQTHTTIPTLPATEPVHHVDFRPDLHTEPPNQPSMMERAASPEYDMTSAVKYNESKVKSARSRLSIHDIIESSSRDQSTQGPGPKAGDKRKACDISDLLTDEVRAWASSQDISQSSDIISNRSPKVTRPSAELIASPRRNERPAKRLKTLLERAAYAAVGGVAVGAGLFLGLVATAPNFS